VKDLFWFTMVRRCFSLITALPVQAPLVNDVKGMAKYLADLPDADRLGIIFVMRNLELAHSRVAILNRCHYEWHVFVAY
jgi:hypothetical protein